MPLRRDVLLQFLKKIDRDGDGQLDYRYTMWQKSMPSSFAFKFRLYPIFHDYGIILQLSHQGPYTSYMKIMKHALASFINFIKITMSIIFYSSYDCLNYSFITSKVDIILTLSGTATSYN